MERDHLKIFYEQETVREAVKQFLLDTLDEQVLDRAYKQGDVVGYREAREVVCGAFSRLNELYAKKETVNNENKAR